MEALNLLQQVDLAAPRRPPPTTLSAGVRARAQRSVFTCLISGAEAVGGETDGSLLPTLA
eukprot:scaffold808_cov370-Prasinococcus_capsulatus_cf.AAC.20